MLISALRLLVLLLFVFIFPQNILAQEATNPSTDVLQEVNSKNFRAPQNGHYAIDNTIFGIACELVIFKGCVVGNGLASGPSSKLYVYNGPPTGGALGIITLPVVAMMGTPPTSTEQYLASVADGFGIISPTFAQVQGSGSGIIQPVLQLWQVMRNIAYSVFIVLFMVIGFMIMFRQKLNPQTVISIQSALPGLVIGLVLITFSYFLSALIVDISFFGMQLVAQVFAGIPNVFNAKELANNSNVLNLWSDSAFRGENFTDAVGGIYRTVVSASGPLPGAATAVAIPAVIGAIVGSFLVPGIGTLIGGGVGAAAPLLAGLLVPLILIIALFIQFMKLLIKLLNSYIMILVTTILAPMFIFIGTFPGQSKSIGFWWRNLLGHSLTFPAVFATFLFAGMILKTPSESWIASPPLFGGLSTELLRLAIAYGIILGTPAVPDIVKKFVGAQDLGAIGTEGIRGFAGGLGVGKVGVNKLIERPKQEAQAFREQWARNYANPPGGAVPPLRWYHRLLGGRQ